jgi:hypothetical protein
MGKSKAKKYKNKWNNNPTGLQSVKDLENEEIELTIAPSTVKATSQNTLQNILEEVCISLINLCNILYPW